MKSTDNKALAERLDADIDLMRDVYMSRAQREAYDRIVAAALTASPQVDEGRELDRYDAGLLNDFGGGYVDWWQDYIRAELDRAHEFYQSLLAPQPQGDAHPDDAAVDAFAVAMKEKLAAARAKGRGGWQDKDYCPQQALSDMLRAHVEKGDPRDVANFAMFLHQRGEAILPDASGQVSGGGEVQALWEASDLAAVFKDECRVVPLHAALSAALSPTQARPDEVCASCYPNGVFDTEGHGPFDCYVCGKPAPTADGVDEFHGDNAKLVSCITALLSLDNAGALVPHGIGGHARTLLTAAAHRLAHPAPKAEVARLVELARRHEGHDPQLREALKPFTAAQKESSP